MTECYALGVDVGGTFTDFALVRLSDGRVFYHKIASTPKDPSQAVMVGMEELLASVGAQPAHVSYFGHGTTVATNALLEGQTALTALITTAGFRDVLEIRRQRQPHNYDIRKPKPLPPVPRHLRREMEERTYLNGRPALAPSVKELDAVVMDFRREGVEAVAVAFLHSYHNPAHEAQVVEWVRERCPEAFVCASHEVLAEFREYERVSTTVLNAALGPIMSRYLDRLEERVSGLGLGSKTHILQSNGGVASAQEAGRRPVRTLASGPAAGVIGASHPAFQLEARDIITLDVGGTSADVCLIEAGMPLIAQEREFGGYPVRFPMVDVHSVGAGGGSIAWIDAGGFLQIGPKSAGANPGPACYGRGGQHPTVTDANLVIGRLNPDTLLGGRMPIRADLARTAIEREVAKPLGMSVEQASHGMLTILNENLMQAVRVISVERGFDPRRFTLVAFGGAGPLLASSLARELSIAKVLVPQHPGIMCALGILVADVRSDFSLTRIMDLEAVGSNTINQAFLELERRALAWLQSEGAPREQQVLLRAIDMRYLGQSHELTVSVETKIYRDEDLPDLARAFNVEHERVYGYASGAPMQFVTFRVSAGANIPRPSLGEDEAPSGTDLGTARLGTRRVHFAEQAAWVDCPVYERARLPLDVEISGPAILEQMDATTLILPDQVARRDRFGNLMLTFSR